MSKSDAARDALQRLNEKRSSLSTGIHDAAANLKDRLKHVSEFVHGGGINSIIRNGGIPTSNCEMVWEEEIVPNCGMRSERVVSSRTLWLVLEDCWGFKN